MNIFIIGDKYQKGMKSKGCPALIPINKSTNIVQNQYKILKSIFPEANIIYISGFEYKKIQNFLTEHEEIELNLIINYNFNDYHDVDSLSNALDYFDDDSIIISGYHILNKKIFRDFNNVFDSQIFVSENKIGELGCIIHDDVVKNIGFDLSNYLTNIYYIKHQDAQIIKNYIEDKKFRNYFLFEIINILIDESIVFKPHFITQKLLYDK